MKLRNHHIEWGVIDGDESLGSATTLTHHIRISPDSHNANLFMVQASHIRLAIAHNKRVSGIMRCWLNARYGKYGFAYGYATKESAIEFGIPEAIRLAKPIGFFKALLSFIF